MTTKAATRNRRNREQGCDNRRLDAGRFDERDLLQEGRSCHGDEQEHADEPQHAAAQRFQQRGVGDREYDLCHLWRIAVAPLGTESAAA